MKKGLTVKTPVGIMMDVDRMLLAAMELAQEVLTNPELEVTTRLHLHHLVMLSVETREVLRGLPIGTFEEE